MMGSYVRNLSSHLPVYMLDFMNTTIINVVFSIVEMVFHFLAIMQNMIFDSVFEVDSVLENKSDF